MGERGVDRMAGLSSAQRALLEQRMRGLAPVSAGIPRRPADVRVPLSPGQERLWFLHQMDPDNIAYAMYHAVRIDGPLDADRLSAALNAVVQRHEVLRTGFHTHDGRPFATVHESGCVALRVADVDAAGGEADDELLRRLAVDEIARPFDLASPPLLRALLLRAGPNESVLVLTLHHIVADETSLDVIWDEVVAGYTGRPLDEVAVQYGDFALWQRNRANAPAMAERLAWWRERLDPGIASPVPLPDRPRPSRQSFRGAIETRTLPPHLAAGIVRLARDAGVTPFVLLLTAFDVLLHRWTDATDVVVGTPATGRGRADLERAVGFFVDTLVVRVDLGGDPSFEEALQRVRRAALDALAHQDVPFERLVDALGVERRLDRNPLFQVMFVQRHDAPAGALPPELHVRPFRVHVPAAKFDLTLFFTLREDGIELMCEYATDLFDRDTAHRLIESLESLLGGVLADPSQRLSALPLLSTEETRRLDRWGRGGDLPPIDGCVHERIAAVAARAPDVVAVRAPDHTLTYADLNARAEAVARSLRERGVGPGRPVGVVASRSAGTVVALLGVLKAGGAYVPIDPDWPASRTRLILDDTRADVVLAERGRDGVPAGIAADVLAFDLDEALSSPASALPPIASPDDPAYVIHTSGSTGRPRGVVVTHASLMASTMARPAHYSSDPERFLLLPSFAFDSSVAGLFWTLCTGGTLVLPPHRIEQDTTALAGLMEDARVTHVLGLPTLHALLLEHAPRHRLRSLRVVVVAGEACPEALARRHLEVLPDVELHNEYGPTEATVWSTVYRVPRDFTLPRVPIGRPVAGAYVRVLDAHGAHVPIGVPGELYIGGPGVARGYLGRPEETAARFVEDRFASTGARMYRTGDRVRWLASGDLEFLGRVDRQIKVRGYRIEPAEIEAVLCRHPAVREAVVQARGPAVSTSDLVAALEALDAAEADRLLREIEEAMP